MLSTVHLTTPAAPGNNATAVLFDSTQPLGTTGEKHWLARQSIAYFEVSFLSVNQASAANGLKFYASSDGGTNWDQIEAGITIAATTSGVVDTYRRYIGCYTDFKAEYTAGATGPTTWRVAVTLTRGDRARVT